MKLFDVVVGTCDLYLDLIPNYLKLYNKYSSLDFPLIIGETQTIENIKIFTPGSKSWGQRMLEGLDNINSKYIFLALDDYYLQTPIDKYINYSIQMMESKDLDKISFISNKHFKNYKLVNTNVDNFYMMDNSCKWLATLQMGIWKTEVLKTVLQPSYSPWDFELKGRNSLTNKKCAVLDPNCELIFNFVRKGKKLSSGWEQFLFQENLTYIPQ